MTVAAPLEAGWLIPPLDVVSSTGSGSSITCFCSAGFSGSVPTWASAFSASVAITAMGCPTGITSPSFARISSNTPAWGEGTSVSTLSVATSRMDSSCSIVSPFFFNQVSTVASMMLSPILGINNSTDAISVLLRSGKFIILPAYFNRFQKSLSCQVED